MEKFEIKLKKFSQLTIDLVDIRQIKAKKFKKKNLNNILDVFKKENKILDKIRSIIVETSVEIENFDLNSENINELQKICWFYSQFSGGNSTFYNTINKKIYKLKLEIDNETVNEDLLKVMDLKSEIKKLDEKKIIISNWYYN